MTVMEKTASLSLAQATDPYDWASVLRLIQTEFAYMQGRIDPPSSMHALTSASVAEQARRGEIWVIEMEPSRPIACMFLSERPPELYVSKITVAHAHRGHGLARELIRKAEQRAKALGLTHLTLESRVELTENHAAFAALGFAITDETSHQGYARPTSVTMQRPVAR